MTNTKKLLSAIAVVLMAANVAFAEANGKVSQPDAANGKVEQPANGKVDQPETTTSEDWLWATTCTITSDIKHLGWAVGLGLGNVLVECDNGKSWLYDAIGFDFGSWGYNHVYGELATLGFGAGVEVDSDLMSDVTFGLLAQYQAAVSTPWAGLAANAAVSVNTATSGVVSVGLQKAKGLGALFGVGVYALIEVGEASAMQQELYSAYETQCGSRHAQLTSTWMNCKMAVDAEFKAKYSN